MKSYATLTNLYASLSLNTTASNQQLGQQLMNDRHRYLIQKYFDNERTFQTTTIGGDDYTLTGAPALAAVSATLSVAWSLPTCSQLTNFSNSDQRTVLYTNGSTAISWVGGLSSAATTAITTVGVQRYKIPATISKVINDTISVGQLRYVPAPVMSRAEWDNLNFLPYTSDIVNYFFIYNGAVEFYPIPSTTGNIIAFNYKARVPDFSFLFGSTAGAAWTAGSTAFDYGNGTLINLAVGNTVITGSSTSWNTTGGFPLNVDVSYWNLYLRILPPRGDGIFYPISMFTADGTLVLATPLQNAPYTATLSGGQYEIAQLPILQEDFHDMLPFGALQIYFGSVKKDKDQLAIFKGQYDERLNILEDYAGTKSINVDLGAAPSMMNPNLFPYANNG